MLKTISRYSQGYTTSRGYNNKHNNYSIVFMATWIWMWTRSEPVNSDKTLALCYQDFVQNSSDLNLWL